MSEKNKGKMMSSLWRDRRLSDPTGPWDYMEFGVYSKSNGMFSGNFKQERFDL